MELTAEVIGLGKMFVLPTLSYIVANGCKYIERKFDLYTENDIINMEMNLKHAANLTAFQVIVDGKIMEKMFITNEELEAYNRRFK